MILKILLPFSVLYWNILHFSRSSAASTRCSPKKDRSVSNTDSFPEMEKIFRLFKMWKSATYEIHLNLKNIPYLQETQMQV